MVASETGDYGDFKVVIEADDSLRIDVMDIDAPDENPTAHTLFEYNNASGLIHIFPKSKSFLGTDSSSVKEFRIDVALTTFEPSKPLTTYGLNDQVVGLPDFFGKTIQYGMTVPRKYRCLLTEIESLGAEILHVTGEESHLEGNTFFLNVSELERFVNRSSRFDSRADDVKRRLRRGAANETVARALGETPKPVSPGRIPMTRAITSIVSGETDLDEDQREELLEATGSELAPAARDNSTTLGKLRQDIELVTLDELIDRFENALKGSARSEERTWQEFFAQNHYALQQLFSSPVVYAGENVNVALPSLSGSGLRMPDYLLVNTASQVAHLVEIKTPATSLTSKQPYRGQGTAEIYSLTGEFSGAVAQLQAQMNSATTDLPLILARSDVNLSIQEGLVRGALVAGTLSDLNEQQKASFLRFRESLPFITILTYDEVLERLKSLRSLLQDAEQESS